MADLFISKGQPDFNSDCSYFDESTLSQYFPEQYYTIITGNDFDTNLSCSECTYDRIIVSNGMVKTYSGSKGYLSLIGTMIS